jgi:dolichyl-phosphate beta-glucosyltransferase
MGIVQDTIVVVPCFNEASRLDVDAFRRALEDEPKLRFLFVDDGSNDRTAEILQGLVGDVPGRALLLSLEKNSGKAEAVRRGVLAAAEHSPELVGYWDADLATPLRLIARFASTLENPSLLLAMGSRLRRLGGAIERTATRHYLGRVFATLAAATLGLGVYDTQCGAKLFRMNDLMRSVFERPFQLRWCFDIEILARLLGLEAKGLCNVSTQCVEVVLDAWVDAPGSKIGVRQVPKVLGELARLPLIVWRERQRL